MVFILSKQTRALRNYFKFCLWLPLNVVQSAAEHFHLDTIPFNRDYSRGKNAALCSA